MSRRSSLLKIWIFSACKYLLRGSNQCTTKWFVDQNWAVGETERWQREREREEAARREPVDFFVRTMVVVIRRSRRERFIKKTLNSGFRAWGPPWNKKGWYTWRFAVIRRVCTCRFFTRVYINSLMMTIKKKERERMKINRYQWMKKQKRKEVNTNSIKAISGNTTFRITCQPSCRIKRIKRNVCDTFF